MGGGIHGTEKGPRPSLAVVRPRALPLPEIIL
jgi:hypothetical protein